MFHGLSAAAHARAVGKTADVLGAPLPDTFITAVEKANALTAQAESIASANDLNAAVLDALAAGRDFHADKTIQKLALDRVLASQGIDIAAREYADQQQAAMLADQADAILESWADALTPHTAALELAATEVPDLDLQRGDHAAARGTDVLHHWAAVRQAVDMWTAALRGFGALADASGVSYAEQHMWMIYTDASAAQIAPAFEDNALDALNAWLLARHAIPLDLATTSTFMARYARYEQQREAAARERSKQRERAGFDTAAAR